MDSVTSVVYVDLRKFRAEIFSLKLIQLPLEDSRYRLVATAEALLAFKSFLL